MAFTLCGVSVCVGLNANIEVVSSERVSHFLFFSNQLSCNHFKVQI